MDEPNLLINDAFLPNSQSLFNSFMSFRFHHKQTICRLIFKFWAIVKTASGSCPLARESMSWGFMLNGVWGARRVFQGVWGILLIVVIDSGVNVWMLRSC